jgi:hypothetical protein
MNPASLPTVVKRVLKPVARMVEEVLHHILYNRSALGLRLLKSQQRRQVRAWEAAGRPAPPPDAIKHSTIRAYARRFGLHVLVETGTFVGDTPYSLQADFARIFTIELDQRLSRAARRRFREMPHISVVQGDSSVVLRDLARTVAEPVLFWLDGHWSGGVTAKGPEVSPVLNELATILDRDERDVVLIDDARLFGTEGYPTLEDARAVILSKHAEWDVYVAHDIIRTHAREAPQEAD